jgi:acyl carrier protein
VFSTDRRAGSAAPIHGRGLAPVTCQDEHLRALVTDLIAIKPTLRPEDIDPASSLTEDLGFGSLELVELASRIRDNYPGFDLTRWLVQAVEPAADSVLSMAMLLAEATKDPEIPNA